MNRVEVLEKVGPLVDGQLRPINDAHGARVSVSGETVSFRPRRGSQILDVAPEGVKAMVNLTGIPIGIAKNLTTRTFSDVLSQMLEHVGSYNLVVSDGTLTDMMPYELRPTVAPERLLNTIEKSIPVREYNQMDILPSRVVSLEIVGEKTKPVARGELVRAGVKVVFSPMGTISPMVQSYASVLACTNGMTSNRVLAEFTAGGGGSGGGAGDGDGIWQFFRQSVRRAYNSFEGVVEGYKKLQAENIRPEDRAQLLETLLKQARIGGKVAEAVRGMAIERPPQNSWELQNLITYASSHLLEAGPRQRAQQVSADFADEDRHSRTCPYCQRVR